MHGGFQHEERAVACNAYVAVMGFARRLPFRSPRPFISRFLLSYAFPAVAVAQPSFDTIALSQCSRFPAMQARDLYKLVYHGAMGNEHLMTDTIGIFRYLQQELESVEASDDEPLVEPVRPDSQLVRLNLRPFKARGGDPKRLFAAMLSTSTQFRKSEDDFGKWWSDVEKLAAEKRVPVGLRELRELFTSMHEKHFPAVHHSEEYRDRYRPAYRVILLSEVSGLFGMK